MTEKGVVLNVLAAAETHEMIMLRQKVGKPIGVLAEFMLFVVVEEWGEGV